MSCLPAAEAHQRSAAPIRSVTHMKIQIAILLFLFLFGCSTAIAQKNQANTPRPPSDESNPQKWVSYGSEPGKFKIKFPAEPHESSEVQEGESGPSTVHIAEYKGLLYYATTYGDSASHIDDAKGFLNKVSATWLDANSLHNIHLLSNDPISFKNYPGRVVVVETQMEVIRARWIVVRDRIYYQFVLAPKRYNAPASENGYAKLATAFFDSFELIR